MAIAVGRPGEQPPPGFPRHGLCTNHDSYEHRHIAQSIRAPADPNGGAEGKECTKPGLDGREECAGKRIETGVDGGW